MHFNEMSVKSRQLGLTFVAAALGVAVVLITRGENFAVTIPVLWDIQIHISVLLILSALLALLAVRTLDLKVYHRMLRGAVTFGEDFEQHYMKKIFDLDKGMTQAISHFSRFDDAGAKAAEADGKYKYTGNRPRTAEDKIKSFYNRTSIFLVIAAIIVFILTNVQSTDADTGCSPKSPPADCLPIDDNKNGITGQ